MPRIDRQASVAITVSSGCPTTSHDILLPESTPPLYLSPSIRRSIHPEVMNLLLPLDSFVPLLGAKFPGWESLRKLCRHHALFGNDEQGLYAIRTLAYVVCVRKIEHGVWSGMVWWQTEG